MANRRAIPRVSNFQLHWTDVKRWKTTFGLNPRLGLVGSCPPWWLRRQKMSLLFTSLCGVLEEELVLLSHPQAGMEEHRLFVAAGSRDSVTGWANTDPSPLARTHHRAQHTAHLAQQRHRTTHSCVPNPIQAQQHLQGLREHSPTSAEAGKEDTAPSLSCHLKKHLPRCYKRLVAHAPPSCSERDRPFSQQVSSALSPRLQHLCPRPKAWKHGMCCASGPRAPPAPPSRAMRSTRYGRQMRVWHRLTSSEGSGMSGAPCPPAWPSKAEEGLKVRSLCGWLLEAAGGGCRVCWVGGPLWCNGCPDWLLGWGTCKPCCMEVWDWSVLPGWGICGGGKKQEKKVRPQGTSARRAWLCNCML